MPSTRKTNRQAKACAMCARLVKAITGVCPASVYAVNLLDLHEWHMMHIEIKPAPSIERA